MAPLEISILLYESTMVKEKLQYNTLNTIRDNL